MCNLYSITTNQEAICALFGVVNRFVDNLPPMPGVFPDYPAPVVRNADDTRKLIMMRWGMPPPPRTGGPPVTNIRNTSSPHWRGWLRCLVPAHLGSGVWPCELEYSRRPIFLRDSIRARQGGRPFHNSPIRRVIRITSIMVPSLYSVTATMRSLLPLGLGGATSTPSRAIWHSSSIETKFRP